MISIYTHTFLLRDLQKHHLPAVERQYHVSCVGDIQSSLLRPVADCTKFKSQRSDTLKFPMHPSQTTKFNTQRLHGQRNINRVIKRKLLNLQGALGGTNLYSNYNDDIRVGTSDLKL